MKMFNESERKARSVMELVSEHKTLTLPNPKPGRPLTPESGTLL